jgi:hypothetical protein
MVGRRAHPLVARRDGDRRSLAAAGEQHRRAQEPVRASGQELLEFRSRPVIRHWPSSFRPSSTKEPASTFRRGREDLPLEFRRGSRQVSGGG